MEKYKEFDEVLLKDGRIGAITDILAPGVYLVDVGSSPKDWDNIYVEEKDIERAATKEEVEQKFKDAGKG